MLQLAVILPTFNERKNIAPMVERLDAALKGLSWEAIFVDDIHLLAVTDQNKDVLAKLFKSFFDRSQQVVITSMYPPKALGTLGVTKLSASVTAPDTLWYMTRTTASLGQYFLPALRF